MYPTRNVEPQELRSQRALPWYVGSEWSTFHTTATLFIKTIFVLPYTSATSAPPDHASGIKPCYLAKRRTPPLVTPDLRHVRFTSRPPAVRALGDSPASINLEIRSNHHNPVSPTRARSPNQCEKTSFCMEAAVKRNASPVPPFWSKISGPAGSNGPECPYIVNKMFGYLSNPLQY